MNSGTYESRNWRRCPWKRKGGGIGMLGGGDFLILLFFSERVAGIIKKKSEVFLWCAGMRLERVARLNVYLLRKWRL